MVVYLLESVDDNTWLIRRAGFVLFSDLRLGPAITLARELARDEHQRSGRSVCVEMTGPETSIRLAQYARMVPVVAPAVAA